MKNYEFELNMDNSYENCESIDEWGMAFIWIGKYGAEYNLYVNPYNNCSAIYFMEYNSETDNWETNHDCFEHYEIDFIPNWETELKEAMYNFVINMVKEKIFGKMNYKYNFHTNFEEDIINNYRNKKDCDEWGVAIITVGNNYGAELNLCFENGNNYSAIYFQELDENKIWQTNFSECKHYEINFNNPYWVRDLEEEMKQYLFSKLEDNKDICLI